MTNLQFPIIVMRDDAKNIRAHADKMWDAQEKAKALDRADQCDLAAKILELYAQHGSAQPRHSPGAPQPDR